MIQNYAFILLPGTTFRPIDHGYTIQNSLSHPLDVTITNADTVPEVNVRAAQGYDPAKDPERDPRGLKVYTVNIDKEVEGGELHWEVFLTPEAAMAFVDRCIRAVKLRGVPAEGLAAGCNAPLEKAPFHENPPDRGPRFWASAAHHYVITEHVIA